MKRKQHVLFAKVHEQLRYDEEKWMRTQLTFLWMLIGTIMFSGQLAGGLSSEKSSLALVSSVSSPIELFCFSKSLMMFLSILVSRYSCEDFFLSLPIRLMTGVVSLFHLNYCYHGCILCILCFEIHNYLGFLLIAILCGLFACLIILYEQHI